MSDKCRKEIAKREEKARVLKEKASTLPGYLRTSVPRSLLSGTTQLCAQRAAAGSLVLSVPGCFLLLSHLFIIGVPHL